MEQLFSITQNCDFTIRIRARRVGYNRYVGVSFDEMSGLIVNLINLPSQKTRLAYTVDEQGRLVIPVTGEGLVCNLYGIEIIGFYNNGNWRHQIAPAFDIVKASAQDNYALCETDDCTLDFEITIGDTNVSTRLLTKSMNDHNSDQNAHPELAQALNNARQAIQDLQALVATMEHDIAEAGEVNDIQIDGQSILDQNKVANFNSDDFSHVNNIKVNGVPVIDENKEANIPVPTKTSELENDNEFVSSGEMQTALDGKQDTISAVVEPTIEEDGGQPSAKSTFENGELRFRFKNLKGQAMTYDSLTPAQKLELKGKQGDSAIWDENAPHEKLTDIANSLGSSTVKPISQKAVLDTVIEKTISSWDAIADDGITTTTYMVAKTVDTVSAFASSQTALNKIKSLQVTKGDIIRVVVVNGDYSADTLFDMISFSDALPVDGGLETPLYQADNSELSFDKVIVAPDDGYIHVYFKDRTSGTRSATLYTPVGVVEHITNEIQTRENEVAALKDNLKTIVLDNVAAWEQIGSYSSGGTSGMTRDANLAIDDNKFSTASSRDVFYFMAERNTAYKFVVTNAHSSSTKTIGLADSAPADGVSVSEVLATASTAAFEVSIVAHRVAYIFIALRRDTGTTLNVYKGETGAERLLDNDFVTTSPQTLTDVQKRQARDNIGAGADDKAIRILYIGNSLTQDSIAYLPALLDEVAPSLNYQLYDWFVGGYRLDEHFAKFQNGGTASNFSISHRNGAWTHLKDGNAVTIDQVLQNYEFDVLVLQDYFNGTGATSDSTSFSNVIDYIRQHYAKNFKVATMLPPPKRSEAAGGTVNSSIYAKTLNVNKLVLQETEALSAIDVCDAILEATKTELNELGDDGRLSPDGTHSQDGLPCLLQAYVHAMWIFRQLGLPYGIVGSKLRITEELSDSLDIPGPHPGTGLIEGTEAQHTIAQLCAIKADKLGRKLEIEALEDNND